MDLRLAPSLSRISTWARSTPIPHFLTEVGGTLYFVADDGMQGFELWTSDGTGAGTAIVKDIWPGSASSRPRPLLEIVGGDSATRPWTTRAHTSFATSSTTCSSAERCLSSPSVIVASSRFAPQSSDTMRLSAA